MSYHQESFWEPGADTVKVRDTVVSHVTTDDVRQFCLRYHYALTSGNDMWRWGLWNGPTLLGVVSYNLPSQDACKFVFGPEHRDKVIHMGRLAMAEEAPHNSESRLIGGSLHAIQTDMPHVWGVLTYADTSVGHIGYVYQATNAIYTGSGGDLHYFVDSTGTRRATRLDGRGITGQRANDLGWIRHDGGVKHRYVYILGNRRERRDRLALLRLPSLPYPKGDAS